MEFTVKLFVDFLNKLIVLDKDSRARIDAAYRMLQDRDKAEADEWEAACTSAQKKALSQSDKIKSMLIDFRSQTGQIASSNISDRAEVLSRLEACKKALALIYSAENNIEKKDAYQAGKEGCASKPSLAVDEILQGKIDFSALAYKVNTTLGQGRRKDADAACTLCYSTCRAAEEVLKQEISALRDKISQTLDTVHVSYTKHGEPLEQRIEAGWNSAMEELNTLEGGFAVQYKDSRSETERLSAARSADLKQRLDALANAFFKEFPPQELADEYARIYSLEPSYDAYVCCSEMPQNVYISTLEYILHPLGLSEYTKAFLNKYYYFMYRDGRLCVPYCTSFSAEFNYLFRFHGSERAQVVKDACDLGMRLFMMLPPGKVNFTFIDPVTLGESFAMFTRLVDVDDRTSEVINGKIWSAPADIENKLKIMTDHISNVTQRYLQGKYDNIYEYNRVAEQNAEAYQVLMLMDFPAGLTDQSLKYLEQIVTSGPKCGVFTILYRNETQYNKASERSCPLISNIESSLRPFDYYVEGGQVCLADVAVKRQLSIWHRLTPPSQKQLDEIIPIIKKGIKTADKVVIDIEKVKDAETTGTTQDGIRIPIGIHGANEVQYLTLGVGGSHHALIAGVAGSGKSSLLHTITVRNSIFTAAS